MHGGARVGFFRRPASKVDRFEVMLACPHPLPVPDYVVSGGPPGLGNLEL